MYIVPWLSHLRSAVEGPIGRLQLFFMETGKWSVSSREGAGVRSVPLPVGGRGLPTSAVRACTVPWVVAAMTTGGGVAVLGAASAAVSSPCGTGRRCGGGCGRSVPGFLPSWAASRAAAALGLCLHTRSCYGWEAPPRRAVNAPCPPVCTGRELAAPAAPTTGSTRTADAHEGAFPAPPTPPAGPERNCTQGRREAVSCPPPTGAA